MVKNYNQFVEKKKLVIKLEESIVNPNFSIVVPGGCNAKCSFCFYKQSKACESYITKLVETLNDVPSQFYQLSLTGGEPTLSPYLGSILENIDTDRWTHTVMTTNGTKLEQFIPQLKEKINFVNISRHHYDDKINESIFGTNSVPNSEQLKELVIKLQNEGIDVTYTAVITEHLDSKEEIEKFIEFAKSHNINNVFFRKQHGTLDPSEAEKAFESIESDTHSCPVCRNTKQVINESTVTWKASLEEPSKTLGMVYEVVYNEDGTLSKDWDHKSIIDPLLIKENSEFAVENGIFECGGSSYSSCGYSGSSKSKKSTISSGCGYSGITKSRKSTISSGCGYSGSLGCGGGKLTVSSADPKEETVEQKRERITKLRDKKIKKLRKVISDRKKKQSDKYTELKNKVSKFDDFIGESKE